MLGSDNILGIYVLGSTDDDQLGYTLGARDRKRIGIVGGDNMGYPIVSFDGYGLLDGKELGWFVGALGTYDGNILGYNDDEILGSKLGAADRNTIRLDEGNDLGSPIVSFDGSNEVKPFGLLFGEALW